MRAQEMDSAKARADDTGSDVSVSARVGDADRVSADGRITLFVKRLEDLDYAPVEADANAYVAVVKKAAIAELCLLGVSAAAVSLKLEDGTADGRAMEARKRLTDYSIRDGSSLIVTVDPRVSVPGACARRLCLAAA